MKAMAVTRVTQLTGHYHCPYFPLQTLNYFQRTILKRTGFNRIVFERTVFKRTVFKGHVLISLEVSRQTHVNQTRSELRVLLLIWMKQGFFYFHFYEHLQLILMFGLQYMILIHYLIEVCSCPNVIRKIKRMCFLDQNITKQAYFYYYKKSGLNQFPQHNIILSSCLVWARVIIVSEPAIS